MAIQPEVMNIKREIVKMSGIRGLAALFVIAATLWAVASARVMAEDAAALGEGGQVYEEYCTPCHGYDGTKIIPEAPSFAEGESLEKPDAELLVSISDGKGDIMPPWAEDLSKQKMAAVLVYIRTLGVKK